MDSVAGRGDLGIGVVLAPGVYKGDRHARSSAETLRSRFEEQRAMRRSMLDSAVLRETGPVPHAVPPTLYEAVVNRNEEAATSPKACRHTQAEETCYAIRTAAAERALRAMQRENDDLKRREVAHLAKEQHLEDVVDALKAELEAMGNAVARQTVTLSTLSAEMQRRDPYHLIRDKRKTEEEAGVAEVKRVKEMLAEANDALGQLRLKYDELVAEKTENAKAAEQKQQQQTEEEEARNETGRAPELIHHEVDENDDNEATEAAQKHYEALGELYGTLAGLNRLCDAFENPAQGDTLDCDLFKVCVSVLSCLDLPRSVVLPVSVIVRGPSSYDRREGATATQLLPPALIRTVSTPSYARQKHPAMTCPSFTEADANRGVFRTRLSTSWRLSFEVYCPPDSDATESMVGAAVVPVSALLSPSLRAGRGCPAQPSSSFHTVPLYSADGSSARVVGTLCFEVAVSTCATVQKTSTPAAPTSCVIKAAPPLTDTMEGAQSTAKQFSSDERRPSTTTMVTQKSQQASQSSASPPPCPASDAAVTEVVATEELATEERLCAAGKGNVMEVDCAPPLPLTTVVPPPPPAAVPTPPQAPAAGALAKAKEEDLSVSPPAAPSSPLVSLSIYVKEGEGLMDCLSAMDSCDVGSLEALEERAGNVHVRVFVGETSRFSFCSLPIATGSLQSSRAVTSPRWDRETSEFVTVVTPESTIRFELDFIDSCGGVKRMGSCSINAADVIRTFGERSLTVTVAGEPCGCLLVDFASAELSPAGGKGEKENQ